MSGTLKILAAFFGGLLTALTFVFGSGAYWQYRESILTTEQAQDEQHMDNIEEISKISELRKQASNTLYEVLQNIRRYEEILRNYRETKDPKLKYEPGYIWTHIESLAEDYKQLEKDLAQLENRTPRNIDGALPPRHHPIQPW